MNDEIIKSVQKSSIMSVTNLIKETYQVRRDFIKGLDSCSDCFLFKSFQCKLSE